MRAKEPGTAGQRTVPADDQGLAEFLATVAHEIRTPVSSIVGMAELLMNSALPDEQRDDYTRWIFKSASSALKIVNDILDFSKASSGTMSVEQKAFDVRMLCEEVIDVLMPEAAGKGIGMGFRCADDIPVWLSGDAGRIRQILMNLAGNAVKFTEWGEVLIHADCPQRSDRSVTLRIRVVDSGIGIAEEKIPLLFRRFSQVDPSPLRRMRGIGLGLAISKSLVELMQGDMGVESRPGKGSVFWFSLPAGIAEAPRAEPSPTLLPAAHMGELNVLLVEDDPPGSIIASAMLQSIGCRTDVAASGAEALKKAGRVRYDMVFMDCCLPDMDGFEAVAGIRRVGGAPPPVIVALTANIMEGFRERCLEAGMDDYLAKPIRYATLLETLTRWTTSRRDGEEAEKPMADPSRKLLPREGVDKERLEGVSTMFRKTGKDFFPAVVEPFLKNAEASMAVFHDAIEQQQISVVRKTAHRLKGGSSSLGMVEISGICMKILENAHKNDFRNISNLVASLRDTLPGVREQVYEMRKKGLI